VKDSIVTNVATDFSDVNAHYRETRDTPIKYAIHLIGIVGVFLLPMAVRLGNPFLSVGVGALLITYLACHIEILFETLRTIRATQRTDLQFSLGETIASLTVASIACSVFSVNLRFLSEAKDRHSVLWTVWSFFMVWAILFCASAVVFRTNTKPLFCRPALMFAFISVLAICYNCVALTTYE